MDRDPEVEKEVPEVPLVRKGPVSVATIHGAPKMSVEEVNEWIRKSRDREI